MISTLVIITFFSLFSTSVMAYVAMATPIGPWMGPILAIIALLIKKCFSSCTTEKMILAVSSASLGGILAVAFGFSFPTFYFLDKNAFMNWAATPHLFIPLVALLACAGGALGLWISYSSFDDLVKKQELPFPVGTLVYKITNSLDDKNKLYQLLSGFITTLIYCLSLTLKSVQNIIPATLSLTKKITLFNIITIPPVQFLLGQLPMLWSIGFIAGSMITIPLLFGTISKIFIVDVINYYFFPNLASSDFIFAFCSGIVLVGAISTLFTMPQQLFLFLKKMIQNKNRESSHFKNISYSYAVPLFLITVAFFYCYKFSLLSSFYIILFSCICAYQIAAIAGKIGLALLGRFATFVMIPGMLLFDLSFLQITVLATFVEICGGIATDSLFSRKAALLAGIDQKKITLYQIFGLIVCSITVAVIIWFLVTHFALGSELLFAERAQARALLINAAHFNVYAVLCGAVYGFILKHSKVNPMLVMGGLLMPLSLTLGLVLGGISSLLVNKKIDLEPLCSGIFAANSIGMIVHALCK